MVNPEQALVMEQNGTGSSEKGGNRAGSSQQVVGDLQSMLHRSKEVWEIASHFRSVTVKLCYQKA